jgi:uncharacterized protein (UPF0335 family)
MNPTNLRTLINLFESRVTGIDYQETEKQVIAVLKSYNSQVYTKLAQKVERIAVLEAEIKQLKDEVKQSTREDVADLFDAEDAAKTRIVETLSFILQISKDPEPTKAPKYKEILEELSLRLTPELITVLEHLKKTMITVTQKAPGLKIKPLAEGRIGELYAELKNAILNWSQQYDQELSALQQQAQQ